MSDSASSPRPLRSIGAFLAGFAVVVAGSIATDAVLHATGVFPPAGQPMATGLWVLASAYRAVFAIAGGWVTARLAPTAPLAHALSLGGLGTVLALLGTLATWDKGPGFGPHWYPISLVVTSLPCTGLGGVLGARRANG